MKAKLNETKHKTIQITVSPSEKEEIDREARKRSLSTSSLGRITILAEVRKGSKK